MANFCEFAAKPLLSKAGLRIPCGEVVNSPDAALSVARKIGPCMVKAQVPTGKRGKAGGIVAARSADEARRAASAILGMRIDGHAVDAVLVEEMVALREEHYLAVISDPGHAGPLIIHSAAGGMDVEESSAGAPDTVLRFPVDIGSGPDTGTIAARLADAGVGGPAGRIAEAASALYRVYRASDAELVEVNPLAVLDDGEVMALDCKLVVDDASLHRQPELARHAAAGHASPLEAEAEAAGLKYIGLGGSVGILANGAGLTMTTMDAISHFGGSPANFLEIGGEAYTKATAALRILLRNPDIRSILVNFCGAFARTDVMAKGVAQAWLELKPDVPVFFSIHGTGSREAVQCIREELGLEPFERMDDAVRAAVQAAGGAAG